ncbi:hypothetical protein HPP92_028823 [Vanilla planifolia]|uniref:Uncharacterized protein n=1 Tax=Vanilla planifolia TaxID=51239 RepID=A0A835P410_VANPL|nr:hypothetical protein HPP92_028823 [Vanilla planifolia]KAG0446495.1 hypothetical protein HPP92_028812 [Vanilla planifolia]
MGGESRPLLGGSRQGLRPRRTPQAVSTEFKSLRRNPKRFNGTAGILLSQA